MIYLVTTQKQLFDLPDNISFASVDECLKYCWKLDSIGCDTETTGFNPYINDLLCIQLGDGKNQYVIDLETISIQCFKELLELKELIFQNAKFDLRFLYRNNIWPNKIFDTFLAEMVLTTGIINHRRALDALVKRYCTNVTLDKEIRGLIHKEGLSSKVIIYAANDVKYLHEIKEKQEIKIKNNDLKMALKLDNWFVKALAYIEYCGIGFDSVKWNKKADEDLVKLSSLKNELDKWVEENKPAYVNNQYDMFSEGLSCNINWNSPKQVIPLFKELGVDTTILDKDTGDNKDSIDAKLLEKQRDVHPLISKYIEYSKAYKLTSTYGKDFLKYINPITGRVHTTYKQILSTGRMSSGEQNKKTGVNYPNLQNIPSDKRHRECFISEKGNRMVVCDYSGQEDIIFANYCQDPKLLEFYKKKLGDGHSYVAKLCFPELKDIDLKDIKKDYSSLRQKAKSANFAIKFGGNGYTIANNLNISQEEGDTIYENYMSAFTGIKNYFSKVKKQAIENGYILINKVTGRKSYDTLYEEFQKLKDITSADGFWDDYRVQKQNNTAKYINELKPIVRKRFQIENTLKNHSYNYPIQGSGADISKLATCYIFDWIVENNYLNKVKIVNIVHDEIMLECDLDIAEDVAQITREYMEKAGSIFCKIIPLEAIPEITTYWKH